MFSDESFSTLYFLCFLWLLWPALHIPYCSLSFLVSMFILWCFYSFFPSLSSVSSFPLSSHVFLEILHLCLDLRFTEELLQQYFKFTVMWLVVNFIFYGSVLLLWQHFSGEWFLCYCFCCYFSSFLFSCVSAC